MSKTPYRLIDGPLDGRLIEFLDGHVIQAEGGHYWPCEGTNEAGEMRATFIQTGDCLPDSEKGGE